MKKLLLALSLLSLQTYTKPRKATKHSQSSNTQGKNFQRELDAAQKSGVALVDEFGALEALYYECKDMLRSLAMQAGQKFVKDMQECIKSDDYIDNLNVDESDYMAKKAESIASEFMAVSADFNNIQGQVASLQARAEALQFASLEVRLREGVKMISDMRNLMTPIKNKLEALRKEIQALQAKIQARR